MNAIVFVGLTILGCMALGAGFGLEGFIAQGLLIQGGFIFGVIALLCVEDHEKEGD
jgi:hypothetical protein